MKREIFEFLFGLRRHINEGNDDVLFFADDVISLDVGVNWSAALPLAAYFSSVATRDTPPQPVISIRELNCELQLPAATPSNKAIKGMHFHAYSRLRNAWRASVLATIGGKVSTAPSLFTDQGMKFVTQCGF